MTHSDISVTWKTFVGTVGAKYPKSAAKKVILKLHQYAALHIATRKDCLRYTPPPNVLQQVLLKNEACDNVQSL